MSELNLVTKGYMDAKIDDAALFLLDKVYPVGSIVFGNHPAVGTLERYDFGGVVYSDAALTDGQAMTEALPNITGQFEVAMLKKKSETSSTAPSSAATNGCISAYANAWINTFPNTASSTWFGDYPTEINASKSDATYGATTQSGYKVQPKGKNTPAYIRTA